MQLTEKLIVTLIYIAFISIEVAGLALMDDKGSLKASLREAGSNFPELNGSMKQSSSGKPDSIPAYLQENASSTPNLMNPPEKLRIENNSITSGRW